MPAMFRIERFHGEEYSHDPDKVDPQHLAPNDSMVFHQVIESCTQEIPTAEAIFTFRATYKTPFTREDRDTVQAASLAELLEAGRRQLIKGSAIVAYAEMFRIMARMPNLLTAPQNRKEYCLAVRDEVRDAALELEGDPELVEIVSLLDAYCGRL